MFAPRYSLSVVSHPDLRSAAVGDPGTVGTPALGARAVCAPYSGGHPRSCVDDNGRCGVLRLAQPSLEPTEDRWTVAWGGALVRDSGSAEVCRAAALGTGWRDCS